MVYRVLLTSGSLVICPIGTVLLLPIESSFEDCLESVTQNIFTNNLCVNIASENINQLLTDLSNLLKDISNWIRTKHIT